jgi:hypothetical protein
VRAWANIETKPLTVTVLGVGYRRYRLSDPSAEEAMARSLSSYGSLAPITACWRNDWAKAAIFGLNRTGHDPSELEEAWIVQALVREDGLSQVDAAQLLGKHKSWVCRRLAMLERLGAEAQSELRQGLL